MEKVVYVLGAGFSAPLGLPVMKDFLLKAKDMYAANTAKYKHFGEVFRQLDEMAKVKNYFSANLFNIEEVLSILEMESYVEGLGTTQMFTKMIEDVVTFYTPPVNPGGTPRAPRALSVVFDEIWWRHGVFVAGLFGRQYKVWTNQDTREQTITTEPIGKSTAEYAVVTLNYDLVLEKMADVVAAHDTSGEPPRLQIHPGPATGTIGPVVCKLHGSVGSSTIIPPTWNKSLKPEIDAAWREAHQVLRDANYIRFIGYSLPDADAYVRYLLKAAVMKAEHLKRIDVMCLDPDGDVKTRYDSFIDFVQYRFSNSDALDYLDTVAQTVAKDRGDIEHGHTAFLG